MPIMHDDVRHFLALARRQKARRASTDADLYEVEIDGVGVTSGFGLFDAENEALALIRKRLHLDDAVVHLVEDGARLAAIESIDFEVPQGYGPDGAIPHRQVFHHHGDWARMERITGAPCEFGYDFHVHAHRHQTRDLPGFVKVVALESHLGRQIQQLLAEECDALLEGSTLGDPAVKAVIERTPPETVERIRRYLEENYP